MGTPIPDDHQVVYVESSLRKISDVVSGFSRTCYTPVDDSDALSSPRTSGMASEGECV
jgi:hypothetical protein